MTSEEKEKDRTMFFSGSQDIISPFFDALESEPHLRDSFEDEIDRNPNVSAWWDEFMPHYKARNIDMMLPRIYGFMQNHPQDFFDLGLQEECIYELAPAMDKLGRYDEYISLLEKIRVEFPDTYVDVFGALDKKQIEYRISLGHDSDLSPYLQNFIAFPDKSPNHLSEVLDMLSIVGRQDELKLLVDLTALPVLQSKYVVGEGFVADKIFMYCFNPFIAAKDCSAETAHLISETLRNSKLFARDIEDADILRNLTNFIKWDIPLDASSFNHKNKDKLPYIDLRCCFTGFLMAEIGCSPTASHEMSEMVLEYIWNLVFEKKKKNPLSFNIKELDQFISNRYYNYFYVRAISAIAVLQGVVYLHQYLNRLNIGPPQDMDRIINETTKLVEISKNLSSECRSCVERIFRTFPEFKGKVT